MYVHVWPYIIQPTVTYSAGLVEVHEVYMFEVLTMFTERWAIIEIPVYVREPWSLYSDLFSAIHSLQVELMDPDDNRMCLEIRRDCILY